MTVYNSPRTKEVNFGDISKHLTNRGVTPIEESKLGAKKFLLHVIIIYSVERNLLEQELGQPHEIVNGFARYSGHNNGFKEDTYIKYVRDPKQWE